MADRKCLNISNDAEEESEEEDHNVPFQMIKGTFMTLEHHPWSSIERLIPAGNVLQRKKAEGFGIYLDYLHTRHVGVGLPIMEDKWILTGWKNRM